MNWKNELQLLADQSDFFSSDSRDLSGKGIFVALKGARVDGHTFIKEVLQKSSARVVAEKGFPIKDERIVYVDDGHEAHWYLASLFRKKFAGTVVGVAGSNGKTSCKEFLFELLEQNFNCVKTRGSQNGKLGLPKTLEQLRPEVEVAVVEIGTDAPGDMCKNVSLVDPDVALLTSIGPEHLNLLKDLEGVFKEERYIADFLNNKARPCFIPSADAYLQRLVKELENIHSISINPSLEQKKAHWPEHQIMNLSLACALAQFKPFSLREETLLNAVDEVKLPVGRGRLLVDESDTHLICDHYNSNPASLEKSIQHASQYASRLKKPLVLVLGDMLDLGASSFVEHQRLLQVAKCAGAARILLVGSLFAELKGAEEFSCFVSSKHAAEKIVDLAGKGAVVLFKGSRALQLEHCIAKYCEV